MKVASVKTQDIWGKVTTTSEDWYSSWGGNEMFHSGRATTENKVVRKTLQISFLKENRQFLSQLRCEYEKITELMRYGTHFNNLLSNLPKQAEIEVSELFEADGDDLLSVELPVELWAMCPTEGLVEIHSGIRGWYLSTQIGSGSFLIEGLSAQKFYKYGFDTRTCEFPISKKPFPVAVLALIESAVSEKLGAPDARYSVSPEPTQAVATSTPKQTEKAEKTEGFSLDDLKKKLGK